MQGGQLGAGGGDAPELVGLFGGFRVQVVLADDDLGVVGLQGGDRLRSAFIIFTDQATVEGAATRKATAPLEFSNSVILKRD